MKSQCDIILRELRKNEGSWVGLPTLTKATKQECESESRAVHSRVAALRKRGFDIVNKIEREGRKQKSFYKLNGE